MKALLADDRMEEGFPSDLRVCVSDDYLHVVSWALSIGLVETLVESVFIVIGLVVRRRVDVDQAVVEEFALYSQHADPVIHHLPLDDSVLLIPNHYETDSVHRLFAATVVDVVLERGVGDGVHRREFSLSMTGPSNFQKQ